MVRNALCTISSMQDVQRESSNVDSIEHPTVVISGRVGRPKFEIRHDQLSFLLDNRFTICIADMLAVSERTICRRMSDFSLSVRAQYASLSDMSLIIWYMKFTCSAFFTGYKNKICMYHNWRASEASETLSGLFN